MGSLYGFSLPYRPFVPKIDENIQIKNKNPAKLIKFDKYLETSWAFREHQGTGWPGKHTPYFLWKPPFHWLQGCWAKGPTTATVPAGVRWWLTGHGCTTCSLGVSSPLGNNKVYAGYHHDYHPGITESLIAPMTPMILLDISSISYIIFHLYHISSISYIIYHLYHLSYIIYHISFIIHIIYIIYHLNHIS